MAEREKEEAHGAAKRLNLALQGGGSHGAFTWGVLDRLLEKRGFEIDSICGTSAGAMNAAVLASGFARDGRDGARGDLKAFWHRVGTVGQFSPLQPTPADRLLDGWRLDHAPSFLAFDLLSRMLSPYQLNPGNFHPLRQIIADMVDFDLVRHASGINLFICATNIRTGKVKIFRNRDMSVDCVLASACLPHLFQAIEIDGQHYWDGGYMGNPAIWPLAYESQARDLLIVQINPLERAELPRAAHEIQDRLNEISFNSTLMREMRAIHFVNRLIDGGQLDPADYKRTNIHLIDGGDALKDLHASSKLNAEPAFLDHLFQLGRAAGEAWIERNFAMIGHGSTIDVATTFL